MQTDFGARSFLEAADSALDIMTFFLDSAERKHGLSTEGKIRIVTDLKEPLAAVTDSVARSLYIKEIGERLGIDESALLKEVRQISTNRRGIRPKDLEREVGSRLERKIISMMLQFPSILPEIRNRNLIEDFDDEILKSIGQTILRRSEHNDIQASEIISLIGNLQKGSDIASLAMEDITWDQEGAFKLLQQFETGKNRRGQGLLDRIKAAEAEGDYERVNYLLKERQILAKKLIK